LYTGRCQFRCQSADTWTSLLFSILDTCLSLYVHTGSQIRHEIENIKIATRSRFLIRTPKRRLPCWNQAGTWENEAERSHSPSFSPSIPRAQRFQTKHAPSLVIRLYLELPLALSPVSRDHKATPARYIRSNGGYISYPFFVIGCPRRTSPRRPAFRPIDFQLLTNNGHAQQHEIRQRYGHVRRYGGGGASSPEAQTRRRRANHPGVSVRPYVLTPTECSPSRRRQQTR
jgi:hypothetical protein